MKKRIISLLLALCLCAALLPTTAQAAGNPYPYWQTFTYNGVEHTTITCTYYAWQQVYDRHGISLPAWGNAGSWLVNAKNSGYQTGTEPRSGSLAVWGPSSNGWGHVAYVTSASGGSFTYNEGGTANSRANSLGIYEGHTQPDGYTSWPDGFIYLSSSTASSPTVTFSPWSNGSYTYVHETDAAIGQTINVSGGSCGENGMYLYDANGNFLASAKNPTYTLPQIYFQINAECGYTLTPGTTYKYKFYAVVNGKTYWSDEQSFKTGGTAPVVKPTVTFKPWSNGNYTYVKKTDAAIGQEILVSNGTCGENGIYLYDVNENFLASGKNDSYTLPQIYFQMNDECGYTLTPGTSYKYKFYAVVDGEYYWSDWGTFKTAGTAPAANYSLSLNHSSLSMTVGDEAALSATVSPAGSAVTWKSSNEAVVKVVNGNVTAVKAGSATITATAAGKTATCKVTVTAAATTPDPAPAPGSREQEPNDTIVTANPVSLNTAITGNLYKTSDKDWFEFTLPSAGMVQLSFGHEYVDLNSDCWRTYLYTAENKEIAYFSWKGNATVTEQSCQIGLEAGTYYVCVTKSPAYRYDVDYQLTVNFTASSNWETEFNDTAATADKMALNTKYSGSIMDSLDKDWYVFTMPTSGTVQLVFGNEPVTTFGNNWRTTIYTIENKKVISNTWRGDATTDRTSDECSLAAGTYYLCVEGMIGSNRKDETYWITVKNAAGNQLDAGDIVAPFTDVKASAYYAEPVKWAVDHGVTVGTSATTFSPDATCTNAQILTFIWRAAGSPEPTIANPLTNLSGSEYYAKAAVWVYEKGMVSGTAFDADKACTRAMTMEYLWKQAGSPATAASGKFTDVPSSAAYATAVAWAVNNGITAGTSNTTFSPDSICTRGQIMTFLYRAEG